MGEEEFQAYADRLEKRKIVFDPDVDYSNVLHLGMASHQRAKVEEETRAFQAMSAQKLTETV